MQKGFYHTGGQDRPPAGYQFNSDNQLVINEYEAAAIKDLFRLYNDGLGKSSISEYLKKIILAKINGYLAAFIAC